MTREGFVDKSMFVLSFVSDAYLNWLQVAVELRLNFFIIIIIFKLRAVVTYIWKNMELFELLYYVKTQLFWNMCYWKLNQVKYFWYYC